MKTVTGVGVSMSAKRPAVYFNLKYKEKVHTDTVAFSMKEIRIRMDDLT
jgi:hypothetical protein